MANDKLIQLQTTLTTLTNKLEGIDKKYEGVKIVSAFKGGGYDHSRYYKNLEKNSLKAKIKRIKNNINKELRKN